MDAPERWSEYDGKLESLSGGDQVDILIIHGPFFTMVPQWRPWPLKADLAGKLPDAKVLTWVNLVPLNPDPNLDFWGHPAKLAYIANQILKHLLVKRTRDKEQNKPILLLGLSLGGLILKQALFIATGDPEFQSIIECVRAVLFVGTPNREDEDQSYGEILANVGKFTGPRYGAKSFWNSLQDNSEAFGELTSAWHLLPTIPVYSFSEMKPIDGLSRVLVSKHSATLGIENEFHTPLDATHLELNSLFTQLNPAYLKVYETLKALTRKENLHQRYQTSGGQVERVSRLFPKMFEYICPVCASFRCDDLPVGLHAPQLEYQVEFDPSTSKQLKTWSHHCALANFTYLTLENWRLGHDGTNAGSGTAINPFANSLLACSVPRFGMDAGLVLSVEHDVHFVNNAQCVVHVDPLSEVTKRQIRAWIHECDDGHAHQDCPCFENPASTHLGPPSAEHHGLETIERLTAFLPTRLLDVRALSHIRLCDGEDIRETGVNKYATLSHCWGSSRSFLTTKESLSSMKRGFDVSHQMPKTFRDAIVVAHELGVPYLWIDSLCIIQDDISDWDREASEMARVYTNAYINISAISSDDDAKGFLRRRSFPYATLRLVSPAGQSAIAYLSERRHDFRSPREPHGPLMWRGWVLQEQYLSPRILSFSSSEIRWKCKALERRENTLRPSLSSTSPISGRWRDVVIDFSGRSLTYETDKLLALAGVASTFAGPHMGPYFAGLWKNEFPGNLLFFWENLSCPSEYIAPSWSWAAQNGKVSMRSFWELTMNNSFTATVVDSDMKLMSDNPYGRLREGSSLTIRGHLMPLGPWTSDTVEEFSHSESTLWQVHEAVDGGNEGQKTWCNYDLPHVKPREINGLFLARRTWPTWGGDVGFSSGLMLTPVEGRSSSYKRIGVFRTLDIKKDMLEDILNAYPPQEVTLY